MLHTHTRAGNAVAMQEEGLLPLSQKALIVMGWVAYHDYEGVVLDAAEQARLVADLGDRAILILRNHGLLTCGDSVGAAFVWMHRIEAACRYQVDGMAGGAPLRYPSRGGAAAHDRAGPADFRAQRPCPQRHGMALAAGPAGARARRFLAQLRRAVSLPSRRRR